MQRDFIELERNAGEGGVHFEMISMVENYMIDFNRLGWK